MKFTIEREALSRALQDLFTVVNPGATIPIVRNVLVASDGQNLRMTTTDLDMWATVTVEAVVTEDGEITADAAKLREIASVTPDGADLYCETDTAPARLKVACGRSRFVVARLPASDFPTVEPDPLAQKLTLPAKELAAMLESVSFAMAEKSRYKLHGVYLHTVKGYARMAATNIGVMAYDERPASPGFNMSAGVVIPHDAVCVIESVLSRAVEAAEASLLIGETQAIFSVGKTTVLTKLVEAEYPDYEQLYAKERPTVSLIDTPMFEDSIKRVRIASADKNKTIRFVFTPEALLLRAASMLGDVAEDDLEIDHKGAEIGFSAPSGFFLDVLARVRSETVKLNMSHAKDAVHVSPTNGDRARFLIMPNVS